jgi:hypothetical protein
MSLADEALSVLAAMDAQWLAGAIDKAVKAEADGFDYCPILRADALESGMPADVADELVNQFRLLVYRHNYVTMQ